MKTKTFIGYSKNGCIEYTVELPTMRSVCGMCNGYGKHVNPSIDGHGLSSDDLADVDFREAYFSGAYDVRCEECSGNKVIDVLDEEKCKLRLSTYKGLLRVWNRFEQQAHARAESVAERRMGA